MSTFQILVTRRLRSTNIHSAKC